MGLWNRIKELFTPRPPTSAEAIENDGSIFEEMDNFGYHIKATIWLLGWLALVLAAIGLFFGASGVGAGLLYDLQHHLLLYSIHPYWPGLAFFPALAVWNILLRIFVQVRYVDARSGQIRKAFCWALKDYGDHYKVRTLYGTKWVIEADMSDLGYRTIHVHGKVVVRRSVKGHFVLDVPHGAGKNVGLSNEMMREEIIQLKKHNLDLAHRLRSITHSIGDRRGGGDA